MERRAFRVSTRRQRQSAAEPKTDTVEYSEDDSENEVDNSDAIDLASNPSPLAESHASSEGEESSAETHESTTGLDAALEARKVLPNGQRRPTWQMKQCDSTFCVECDAPVTSGRVTKHVYMKHMDGYPYVCGVCGDGRYETYDMKTHFGRDHAEEEMCFDDKREEIEQDFLKAYFVCFALKPNASVNMDMTGDDGRTRQWRSQALGDGKRAASPEQILQARKLSVEGRRVATWQMQQRDSTFCVECDAPVSHGRATKHVYMKHMDDCPFVCGVCGEGRYEPFDIKVHFGRSHPDDSISFEDRRGEMEQDFLKAYFSCFAPSADAEIDLDKSRSLRSSIGANAAVNGHTAAKQPMGKRPISAELTSRPTLPPRKVSSCGHRTPTWQMQQRDYSFCVECSRPVGTRAIAHIYAEHVRGHPFVCRVCSHGCSETSYMRLHFGRRHPDADVAFDDKRDELEQDFLHAFLACYALRPDVDEAGMTQKELEDLKTVDSSARKRKPDDSEAEVADSCPSAKRPMSSIWVAGEPSKPPAAVYELGETVPLAKPTWRMRQRDTSFCRLCNAPGNGSSATNHINRVHLSRLPYACSVCGLRLGVPSGIKTHAKRVHRGERVRLLDYRLNLQQEFEEKHAMCFGLRAEVEVSADAATHKVEETSGANPASSHQEHFDIGKGPSGIRYSVGESASRIENATDQVKPEISGPVDTLQASEERALSAESEETATEPCGESDTEERRVNGRDEPVVYKLSDSLPNRKPTWQMLQRDISFCVLCETSLKQHNAPEHIYRVHLGQKPLACSICGHRAMIAALIVKHAATHRNEQPRLLDYRPALRQQYEHMHEQCFRVRRQSVLQSPRTDSATRERPAAIPVAAAPECGAEAAVESAVEMPIGDMVKRKPTWQMRQRDCSRCVLCDCPTVRKSHIYEVHMKHAPPFSCSVCNRGFTRFATARDHAKNVHKNEAAPVVDKRADVEAEFQQWHERCFALREQFQ